MDDPNAAGVQIDIEPFQREHLPFYAHLRELDSKEVNLILVEAPPRGSEWEAINDRLTRAAHGYADDEEP